jgi:hypothetical protein
VRHYDRHDDPSAGAGKAQRLTVVAARRRDDSLHLRPLAFEPVKIDYAAPHFESADGRVSCFTTISTRVSALSNGQERTSGITFSSSASLNIHVNSSGACRALLAPVELTSLFGNDRTSEFSFLPLGCSIKMPAFLKLTPCCGLSWRSAILPLRSSGGNAKAHYHRLSSALRSLSWISSCLRLPSLSASP